MQALNNLVTKSSKRGERKLVRRASEQQHAFTQNVAFVLIGASGDLAKKKIYPVLWSLFRDELLPESTHIIGYARSDLTMKEIGANFDKYITIDKEKDSQKFERFLAIISYVKGAYDDATAFAKLDQHIEKVCGERQPINRLFYLAVPPNVYETVAQHIRGTCMARNFEADEAWTRIVIEKPFGRDLASSEELSRNLSSLFQEPDIYRMDHYLGKELVQNLLIFRFANQLFNSIWNRRHISAVAITFKEPFGTEGRAGYFDNYGIIRDVMQNHLMQILSLAAMEKPTSLGSEDVRDEKVKLLKCIKPIAIENCVIGQYTGDPNAASEEAKHGYLHDNVVPKDSLTATFATLVLDVDNERWSGVPFILKAGKALNERKVEIRIQFRDDNSGPSVFEAINSNGSPMRRNELVIRLQPNEAIYWKAVIKKPGITYGLDETQLDMTYSSRYRDAKLPDAYERLLLEVFAGSQLNFVRGDELAEAWRIFTPLLQKIDSEKMKPIAYLFGSRGPKESDELCARVGWNIPAAYSRTATLAK